MKRQRLYYWIAGAPLDRPGGPWWYRDFETSDDLIRHLGQMRGDCIEDLEEAGLIEWHGSAVNPIFRLTEAGYAMASALRKERAERDFAKTAGVAVAAAEAS